MGFLSGLPRSSVGIFPVQLAHGGQLHAYCTTMMVASQDVQLAHGGQLHGQQAHDNGHHHHADGQQQGHGPVPLLLGQGGQQQHAEQPGAGSAAKTDAGDGHAQDGFPLVNELLADEGAHAAGECHQRGKEGLKIAGKFRLVGHKN